MSAKKSRLGRGLESLIPTEILDEAFDPTAEQDEKISDLRSIKLDDIVSDPDQPRKQFDEVALTELAESVREHGILQPIVVTPHRGKYLIVAGERRYRAAGRAGLERIPALVRTLTDQHKLELSLIENLQRRDLNPVETAMAYLKLRDQFNLTLDQIGERVGGKSTSAVSNTLRILRLPEFVRLALANGEISEGQARPLVGLDQAVLRRVVPQIIADDWSARMVEQYVSRLKKEAASGHKSPSESSTPKHQFTRQTERFEKKFSAPVKIQATAAGAGKIVIKFKDADDLDRIADLLGR